MMSSWLQQCYGELRFFGAPGDQHNTVNSRKLPTQRDSRGMASSCLEGSDGSSVQCLGKCRHPSPLTCKSITRSLCPGKVLSLGTRGHQAWLSSGARSN
ncbi:Hypothetical predicted protein [Podarcis lilfordi]|uniref:Uncharacterized protein n=1 Tax=Podarcis lilfordi TaxID=74358 RepID=A0AA35JW62_9SAUR|nr:Hypothetical predicted protein [Podarcis lilfordi]